MARKIFKDISASTVQVLANQAFGLLVFLITSIYLSKNSFGELSWSLALITFITTVLSLRLEQIVVRKSAAGQDSSKIMTLFMMHVILSGVGFYLLLVLLNFAYPSFFNKHNLLLMIGISQLLSFFSSPFKQVANGKERFDYLAIMSSTANMVRSILLLVILVFFELTIREVLIVFIIGSLLELLTCFFLVTRLMKIPFTPRVGFRDYIQLLKESLPQIGAAVLMAGITRMDWILLGVFSTATLTAEYSFAYRVYELSPIPLLIIAPILLSRFTKFFTASSSPSLTQKKRELSLLIRMEMIVATLIPLVINILWTPVVGYLTSGKYGAVNQQAFLILSLCIPFQYITNILWSAHFAQNHLQLIFRVTLITFCIILIGDVVFIPLYGGVGAACVYLTAIVIEYVNYMRLSKLSRIKETWQSLLICLFAASGCGFAAAYLTENIAGRLLLSITLYFSILLASGQLRKADLQFVLQSIRQKNN